MWEPCGELNDRSGPHGPFILLIVAEPEDDVPLRDPSELLVLVFVQRDPAPSGEVDLGDGQLGRMDGAPSQVWCHLLEIDAGPVVEYGGFGLGHDSRSE